MIVPPFERSVFINCPFDEDFAPLLQALAFCVTDLDLFPRLAPENSDNAQNRLDRIVQLIRQSRYGIHDLSRCRATAAGEFARLNMPFELGLDHGCARFGSGPTEGKSILILERDRYDYQKSLSDIAGWDIEAHNGDFIKLVRIVSSWLHRQGATAAVGASRIRRDYEVFQEWYWQREGGRGASEDDIKAYPTVQFVAAMREWVVAGRPSQPS
ncbi:hypothetical protein IP88_15240 [alpha proteobacterium AAP81b]|nr:hypothetical protein IP88_15240 [alpha proteobacterium AAP81b]